MSSPRGILLVISAPLGLGKTTLCQALLDRHPDAYLSVSKTTRPRGPREIEGYDFFFVSEQEFSKELSAGEFLESVRINTHYFGTPRKPVVDKLLAGRDVFLNVDVRGARSAKKVLPEAILVFVCPPTLESLAARLQSLGSTRPELLTQRVAQAREDLAFASEYDYVVTSDNLVHTADDVSAILRVEHRRSARGRVQAEIAQLLKTPPLLS